MKTHDKFVGLDVQKDTIVIAVADGGREGEVRAFGTISSDLHASERALTKLRADGATLHVASEAGPTGFVIQRHLQKMGIDCLVVAPSKMPVPGGKRQKTDRRDAELLARLLAHTRLLPRSPTYEPRGCGHDGIRSCWRRSAPTHASSARSRAPRQRGPTSQMTSPWFVRTGRCLLPPPRRSS